MPFCITHLPKVAEVVQNIINLIIFFHIWYCSWELFDLGCFCIHELKCFFQSCSVLWVWAIVTMWVLNIWIHVFKLSCDRIECFIHIVSHQVWEDKSLATSIMKSFVIITVSFTLTVTVSLSACFASAFMRSHAFASFRFIHASFAISEFRSLLRSHFF